MKASRTRLLTVALVLAVALPALGSVAHAGSGKALLKHVPRDLPMAFAINLDRLRKSDHYPAIKAMMEKNKDLTSGLAQLKEHAGLDLEKDLSTLLIALDPERSGDHFIFLIEGRFDVAKIEAAIKADNDTKPAKHAGVRYYTDGDGAAFAVLGKILAFGKEERVKQAINLSKGKGKSITHNTGFKAVLAKTDTGKDFWGVADMSPKAGFGPLAASMQDFRSLGASVDLRSGLEIRIRVGVKDEKTAQQMSTAIRLGAQGVAGQKEVNDMGLAPVIKKLVVASDGADITLSLDLTKDEVVKLKPLFDAMSAL